MMTWNPKLGKILKVPLEPENQLDKFSFTFEKCDVVVGHLSKGKAGWFSKKLSFFFLVEAMKTLAKFNLFRKEWTLAIGKDSKYPVKSILQDMQNTLTSEYMFYRHYKNIFILFSPFFGS